MDVSTFIKLYLITTPVFFGIDLIWLSVIAKNFYSKQIGHLLSSSPNWTAGIIFYLLFIVGLIIFVLTPAIKDGSIVKAIVLGGLFGFFTYATYDLTNLATLKNWPLIVTVVDIIWGISLSALVSGISFFLAKHFGVFS